MEATRQFLPQAESVSSARRFVVSALTGWTPEATDVVALLTSELVTNAITHTGTHGPGQEMTVSVIRRGNRVRVAVVDGDPALPLVGHAGADGLSGRGLLLVEALAGAWGVVPSESGKMVWFEIDV